MIYWLLTSIFCGIFLCLLFLFLIYWFYIKELPQNVHINYKPQFEDYFITPALQELIKNDNHGAIAAINVLLQFLFQELKDSGTVRRYIIRKMTIEFKELLTTKQIGKIIEKITARDFSLGTGCPIISSLKLDEYKIDKTKLQIQEFSLLMDIEYKDGFSISVDVDLILGRSAYVHIKVVSLKGKARVQFKREPFTHWSFAFVNDPEIEFAATSQFESRQIPQLTSLIINQLRRSVRKKHTLPNYKIRFKPFFDQLIQSSSTNLLQKNKTPPPENCNYSIGKLTVNLQNCDHLSESLLIHYQEASFYLTVSLDQYSFHTLMTQQTNKNDWPIYDVELTRNNLNEQLGITFVETIFLNQNEVAVHKIQPNTIASNSTVNIKMFDILVSINGTKITSLKQAHKLIQKANHVIKMQFQRPIIRINKNGISPSDQKAKPEQANNVASNIEVVSTNEGEFVNINTTAPDDNSKTLNKSNSNNETNSKEVNKEAPIDAVTVTPIKSAPSVPTLATPSPLKTQLNQSSNTSLNQQQSNLTIQLVQNTKYRLEQRLQSFRKLNLPTASLNAGNTETSNPQTVPVASNTTVVTHLASVNALLDFYNAIAEYAPEGNTNDLDLMYSATNENNSSDDYAKRQQYYKKSKKIKIDNNNMNLLNFNETFSFNLNENTKYLNICLCATVVTKSKPRNVLIGYVNIPVNDINAECWGTMKGESKQTCYFKPIETKASAQSRPHVLSSHPGFDSSLTFGAVTLLFQHEIPLEEKVQEANQTASANGKEKTNLLKNTVHKIVDNLFQDLETEKLQPTEDVDKYTHKFGNFQSNETKSCSFCNKKIWLKSAYRCAFCGYIIHIKCYEKAIKTTICPRYSNEERNNIETPTQNSSSNFKIPGLVRNESKQSQLDITTNNEEDNSEKIQPLKATKSSDVNSVQSQSSTDNLNFSFEIPRTRNYVSNLISGLRQRKWVRNRDRANTHQGTITEKDYDDAVIIPSITKDTCSSDDSMSTLGTISSVPSNENNNNNESNEIFQDAQVDFLCEDKQMGKQLYEELPLLERKNKLEEMSFKYQSTLEMMKNLKEDLEKDLKQKESLTNTSNETNRLKEQIKSQIEHLEEQMKSVVFLLMQCQNGIDYCQELIANENSKFN